MAQIPLTSRQSDTIWGRRIQHVHIGCGRKAPDTWDNYDASPRVKLRHLPVVGIFFAALSTKFPRNVRYGDIVKGLPVPDNSCTAVYSSHVLEHLSLMDMRTALNNIHKILHPRGVFRFVVPDLEHLVHCYISDQTPLAAHQFMTQSMLGWETKPSTLIDYIRYWWGNSKHLWMWDYKNMHVELTDVGFVEIRRARMGDSDDHLFADVEESERWIGCLGIECKK